MAMLYVNNASSTLSQAITTSQTQIFIGNWSESKFPQILTVGDYYYATIDDGTNIEIVKVTQTESSTSRLTVVRGQDGTAAAAFSSGSKIEIRVNVAFLQDFNAVAVQEFTNPGSSTWIKPPGAKMVHVLLFGGGGGGGSGRRRAIASQGTAVSGGGGGATGSKMEIWIPADRLGSTENVVVGAGGVGGAAVTTDDTNGNSGWSGSFSTFGSSSSIAQGGATKWLAAAAHGSGGAGGATGEGQRTSPRLFLSETSSVSNLTPTLLLGIGSGGFTGGNAGSGHSSGARGGGGGGGSGFSANSTTGFDGGDGGLGGLFASNSNFAQGGGGAKGTPSWIHGGAGASEPSPPLYGGAGGGGGGNSTFSSGTASTPGGNGGDGGWPGGGGGGGAASQGANSGPGGKGGGGYVRVTTFF